MSKKSYIFKNFNNYYNRRIIRFNTVPEYISYIEADTDHRDYAVRGDGQYTTIETGARMNFAIKDGINASITYNYDPSQDWQPDYVVITDLDNNIDSR